MGPGNVCATAIRLVAAQYGIDPPESMLNRSRKQADVVPRQVAIYLARRMSDACLPTPLSYPVIARRFGYSDHTTAMHAVQMTARRAVDDEAFSAMLAQLTAETDALVDQVRSFKVMNLPEKITASTVCDLARVTRPTLSKRIEDGIMPPPIGTIAGGHRIFEKSAVLLALGFTGVPLDVEA